MEFLHIQDLAPAFWDMCHTAAPVFQSLIDTLPAGHRFRGLRSGPASILDYRHLKDFEGSGLHSHVKRRWDHRHGQLLVNSKELLERALAYKIARESLRKELDPLKSRSRTRGQPEKSE